MCIGKCLVLKQNNCERILISINNKYNKKGKKKLNYMMYIRKDTLI